MPQTARRIVYFLGAGASVAAGAYATVQHGGRIPAPTQSNFWGTFLRFCQYTQNQKTIESFLFRYFLGYGRAPGRLKPLERYSLLNTIEVEEVFTFISERIAAPATSSQLKTALERVWGALTEEIGHIFSKFPANRETRSLYRNFMKRHVLSRDTIISFNYDTIFEGSLSKRSDYFYEGVEPRKKSAVRVLKPHGSINWELADGSISIAKTPRRSVVVAPTHLKFIINDQEKFLDSDGAYGYLNQTREMSNIWHSMEQQMRGAKALVFIGYSFPVADLYFSSVFRSVLADRENQPRVVVVNPDAFSLADRIQKRFALKRVEKYFDFQQFNQASRLR